MRKPLRPQTAAFTEREARIFTAVAEAVTDVSLGREAARAATPFLERMPGSDRRLISLALGLLEYGAPILGGRPRRFSSLSRPDRAAILRRWADSPLPPKRQLVSGLRTLSGFAVYGRQDSWAEIGYDGPWLGRRPVEVLPAPDLRAGKADEGGRSDRPPSSRRSGRANGLPPGVTDGTALEADVRVRVQVCVVGTGAGGSAALARLAEAGIAAMALESGPYVRAEDHTQRELDMLPLLYREGGLQATADKAIGILQGRGVGGSTLHNTGLVYAPPEGVLHRWKEEHGVDLTDSDFRDAVDSAVGALRAVPIPPEEINRNNALMRAGAEALGWRYRVPMHNRVSCSACGYCMLGCAYNRKRNAALSWLPEAVDRGTSILAGTRALRIERAGAGWRVIGRPGRTKGRDGAAGRKVREVVVEAERVIVAAGALATPALLRASGLGNGRVGRGLRLHPAAVVGATFPDPVRAWRGLPQSVILEEFATFMGDGHGGFLVIPGASNGPAFTAALSGAIGGEHRSRMRELPRLASAAVVVHDETEGRVGARRDGRPRVRYWPDRDDLDLLRRGIDATARLFFAAGAEGVHLPFAGAASVRSEAELGEALRTARLDPYRLDLVSVHPQGSCPMGSDRRAAAGPDGRLLDVEGIHLADTSLFPTSVGVPPQVTAMALGRWVAGRVAAALPAPSGSGGGLA